MLTRKHGLIFLVMTCILLAGLFVGREVRTMANYEEADGPRFAGQFAPPAAPFDGTLKVITWNIRFGEDVETAVTELQTNPDLQDADILFLQEMDEQGVDKIARELGYHYVYYPASVHSHHNRNFGNAILAKWPITEDKKLMLPYENPSNEQRRTAVVGTVTIEGQALRLYSVHTETLWLAQGKRHEQAKALAADILAESGDELVLVGGDFNTLTEADVAELEAILAQAALERVSAGAGPSVVVAGLEIEADHLFARGFTTKDNGTYSETTASDHFPVWAVIALKP